MRWSVRAASRSALARPSLAVIALAAACGFPAIDGEQVMVGRHVELHAAPTLAVCAPALASADDYVERVGDFLDVPPPRVTYHLYDGAVSGCHLFGGAEAGCASGSDVYTADWIQRHELVHVVARSLGRPPPFLTEGLAEGLGSPYPQLTVRQRRASRLEDAVDPVGFFTGSVDDVQAHYAAAADFTVFAIHRFGIDRFRRLYGRLLFLSDGVTVRRAFADTMGASLEDALAAWRAHTPVAADGAQPPLDALRCAAPPLAPVGPDAWSATDDVACANGGTSRGGSLEQPIVHAVTLGRAGLYALDADVGPAGGTSMLAQVLDCGVDDQRAYVYQVPDFLPRATELAVLAAGPHVVELDPSQSLDGDPPALAASFQLARVGDVAADCAGAPVWTARAGAWSLTVRSAPDDWPGVDGDDAATWVRIELPPGAPPRLGIGWDLVAPAPGATLRVCAGSCAALTDCVTVAGDAPAVAYAPPSGPLFVEVRAPRGADPIEPVIRTAPLIRTRGRCAAPPRSPDRPSR